LNRYDFVFMCEWSLLVRIYDYLLINNKKLSISD
jgi:hypothetical protein